MIYVLAYYGQKSDSCLSLGLGIKDLSKLRILNCTYDEYIKHLCTTNCALINEKRSFLSKRESNEIKHLSSEDNFSCGAIDINSNFKFYFLNEQLDVNPSKAFEKVKEDIEVNKIKLTDKDKLIIINMAYYPCDFNFFNSFIVKTICSDLNCIVLIKDTNISPIFIFRARILNLEYFDLSNFVSLESTCEQLVDTSDIVKTIGLFNSNFITRHFNSMSISRRGYYVKKSAKKEKMLAEYTFIKDIPSVLRPYYPHVGDYIEVASDDGSKSGYEIEMIHTLDISKLLFNGALNNGNHFDEIANELYYYLKDSPKIAVTKKDYLVCASKSFLNKTEQRCKLTRRLDSFDALNNLAKMRGYKGGFDEIVSLYLPLLEKDLQSEKDLSLTLSHGDLFFANILYDPLKHNIKLIDPRGKTPNEVNSEYLPKWYDLAKLSHSFLGLYDFIIYDLVDIKFSDDLKPYLEFSKSYVDLTKLQDSFVQLLNKLKVPIFKVRLYEASMFLSMLPLHKESPSHMAKQFIRFIDIFEDIKSNFKS